MYGFYIDNESASLELHMEIAGAPHGNRQRGVRQAGAPD
jgi:hypothetical protein